MNDPNDGTWTYEYDCGGNILNKKQYAYTTGTLGTVQQIVSYAYGDADWKDKLTRYNGVDIAYDAIGNPIQDGVWTYTWENGRQLRRMACDATIAEFVYNADGLRVQKTVNGVATNYTLHGKNIVHMTKGNAELHFWYDAQNRPAIVEFNGTKYGYLYNLQGDVIGLIDSANTEVVKYTYDALGKLLSVTGSLANTIGYYNPFRYRGYVYDVETGLYYLRSRYYNPRWGRFINADGLVKGNLFCYCVNSPLSNIDSSGKEPAPYDYTAPPGPYDYTAFLKDSEIKMVDSKGLPVLDLRFIQGAMVYVFEDKYSDETWVGAMTWARRPSNGTWTFANGYIERSKLTDNPEVALFPRLYYNEHTPDEWAQERIIRYIEAFNNMYGIKYSPYGYTRTFTRLVKDYQSLLNLTSDGVVGPETKRALTEWMIKYLEPFNGDKPDSDSNL